MMARLCLCLSSLMLLGAEGLRGNFSSSAVDAGLPELLSELRNARLPFGLPRINCDGPDWACLANEAMLASMNMALLGGAAAYYGSLAIDAGSAAKDAIEDKVFGILLQAKMGNGDVNAPPCLDLCVNKADPITYESLWGQIVIRGGKLTAKESGEPLCYEITGLHQWLKTSKQDPTTRTPFNLRDMSKALNAGPAIVCKMPSNPAAAPAGGVAHEDTEDKDEDVHWEDDPLFWSE